ncbi:hypothetical protein LEP1GSC068_2707 [Leptospira sp. Fiocruz LV3954]|nr:hypothetical protein LEP1GSC068_2707 [Leptospira sp. Fiocruz LV3954]EMI68619.1 hypothetical protein LEP1GSC076_0473 [Leptospira sp. Fiocruz LV4135]
MKEFFTMKFTYDGSGFLTPNSRYFKEFPLFKTPIPIILKYFWKNRLLRNLFHS